MASIQEVSDPPPDAITSVKWSADEEHLLVGSWDDEVRVYRRDGSQISLHKSMPAITGRLDVCWGKDSSTVYSVGLDGEVRKHNVDSAEQSTLSKHDMPSNKVAYSAPHDLVLSISWDAALHVHDGETGKFVRIKLAAKPFALSMTNERAVVAMAERKVSVYDLAALRSLVDEKGSTETSQEVQEIQLWQERESSLKFMTRAVACMPDGAGFATSSIEGRVGVEWFDPNLQSNTYAFKCHRQTETTKDEEGNEEEVDVVYPVNALSFHPTFGTFATGGGDGVVGLWDAKSKRRVRLYPSLEAGVATLDFSPSGKFLAIGISPSFEEDQKQIDTSKVKLYMRTLGENEAKPKEKDKK